MGTGDFLIEQLWTPNLMSKDAPSFLLACARRIWGNPTTRWRHCFTPPGSAPVWTCRCEPSSTPGRTNRRMLPSSLWSSPPPSRPPSWPGMTRPVNWTSTCGHGRARHWPPASGWWESYRSWGWSRWARAPPGTVHRPSSPGNYIPAVRALVPVPQSGGSFRRQPSKK